MASSDERRRTTRVETTITGEVFTVDGTTSSIQLANLSVVGLRATVSHTIAPGTHLRVELRAPGASIEARGSVVRSEEHFIALRFDELPFESFERLRAFLLSHADDPAVIADELSERLGFLSESA